MNEKGYCFERKLFEDQLLIFLLQDSFIHTEDLKKWQQFDIWVSQAIFLF